MLRTSVRDAGRVIPARYPLSLLLLLVILSGINPAFAALPDADSLRPVAGTSPSPGDTIWTDIKQSGTDALLLFSAPARFTFRQWGTVGWVVAGTGIGMAADDRMRQLLNHRGGDFASKIAATGNFYGTGIPTLGISAVLYTGGLIFDNPGVRLAGRHILQSALYAGAITTTLKVLLGRHRPFLNDGPYKFNGPSVKDDFNSLPSGHSTMAFALSSSLAADIDNPWATAGLYGLAAITAYGRMHDDRHWLSDVFLGAAIGTACGYGVHHLHDADPEAMGLLVVPTLNGVAVSLRF